MRSRIRRHRFSLQTFLATLLAMQLVSVLLWLWPADWTVDLSLASEPVNLSVVISEDEVERKAWENLVEAFEAEHRNITIKLAPHSDSTNVRESIYRDDFDADGKADHDLVLMDVVWIEGFIDDLVDLRPLVEKDGLILSEFLESELEIGERGTNLYRVPMYPDIGVLYYRQDLLSPTELSRLTTLDSLGDVVSTLKKSPTVKTGYLWQGDAYEGLVVNFVELMNGMGAQWIDDDHQVRLSDAKTVEAAEVFKALLSKGISPDIVKSYDETRSLEAFLQGEAVFLRGWPKFWAEIQASDLRGKVGIASPFSFSRTSGMGCRGGWGLGISKKSAHPQEAWEAIKYFTSRTAQEQFVIASGVLPSRKALFKSANIINQNSQTSTIPEVLRYLEKPPALRPAIKQYRQVSKILQNSLQKMLWGDETALEAMNEAQQETVEFLASLEDNI